MTEYKQPKVRNGDEVLIRAKVHSSRARPELIVEFKNGDSLPIASVEIDSVSKYDLRSGDYIWVRGGPEGKTHMRAAVKAVITDISSPQVVYQIDGQWALGTVLLKDVRRID